VIVGDEVKMQGWSRGSLQAHSNSEIYFNGQPNAIFRPGNASGKASHELQATPDSLIGIKAAKTLLMINMLIYYGMCFASHSDTGSHFLSLGVHFDFPRSSSLEVDRITTRMTITLTLQQSRALGSSGASPLKCSDKIKSPWSKEP